MKKLFLILMTCMFTAIACGQYRYPIIINPSPSGTPPYLYLDGTGGYVRWTGNIYMTQSAGKITFSGANLDMGANALLGTGAIGGAGAAKHSKGWFTDLESTNDITINGTALASIYATITSLNAKQATLISGSNIKTVGGITLLGAGDIPIAGTGTVTSVAVTTDNGVSATITNPTSAANLTFSLGAIVPTSVNGIVLSGSSTPTLAVSGTTSVSGVNTGDNSINTRYEGTSGNATHTGDAIGATTLTVVKINGTLLSGLATGLLKNTTGTGVPTIALAGTDYLLPSGNAATATKLATSRTINGTAFDGSTNITVPSNIAAGTAGNILTSTGTLWSSAAPAVTLTNTATLTNKTLTAPKVNENVALTATSTELNSLASSGVTSTIDFNVVLNTQISAALTDGTPTAAEINTATGLTPGTAGAGYHRTIKDNNGTGLLYRIESDGTSWFYTVMTKAL